jgi:hypothetical protein
MKSNVRPLLLALLIWPAHSGSAALVARYEFSGNFDDSSGNQLHGTPSTTLEFVPGPPGHGLALRLDNGRFDGTTNYPEPPQYVDCGGDKRFETKQAVTLMAWIKWADPASPAADVILANGSENYSWKLFRKRDRDGLAFEFRGVNWEAGGGAGPIEQDDQWHHYAVIFTGGVFRSYRDGELLPMGGGIPPWPLAGLERVTIGGLAGKESFFSGCLDDVRIYDEAVDDLAVLRAKHALPELRIERRGNGIVVAWPDNGNAFVLETAEMPLPDARWSVTESAPTESEGMNEILFELSSAPRFFRLRTR